MVAIRRKINQKRLSESSDSDESQKSDSESKDNCEIKEEVDSDEEMEENIEEDGTKNIDIDEGLQTVKELEEVVDGKLQIRVREKTQIDDMVEQ